MLIFFSLALTAFATIVAVQADRLGSLRLCRQMCPCHIRRPRRGGRTAS